MSTRKSLAPNWTTRSRARCWARNESTESEPAGVAPVEDCPGAFGHVKTSLATLAADAPLTRPARSCGLATTGATQLPRRHWMEIDADHVIGVVDPPIRGTTSFIV
jgi:hypothetical protein